MKYKEKFNPGLLFSQAAAKQQQQDRKLWVMFSLVALLWKLEMKTHSHRIAMYFHLYALTTVLNTTLGKTISENNRGSIGRRKSRKQSMLG